MTGQLPQVTAWLFCVTVREYRDLEAGDRLPTLEIYERVSSYFGWPQSFWPRTHYGSTQESERRLAPTQRRGQPEASYS